MASEQLNYYNPLRNATEAVTKFSTLLRQPEIPTKAVFEVIADSFAVISGENYDDALKNADEGFFKFPTMGEVDFSYYRYRVSAPDEQGNIEDAGYQADGPSLSFYRNLDGEVSATRLTERDEEPYVLSEGEKKKIVAVLLYGVKNHSK